jgi:uncharacterized small protein (DUF1192 family)
MLTPAWLTALVTLVTLAGGFAVWTARHLWKMFRRGTRFLDDFFGEPAREGLPAKPGVMARLGSVEELAGRVAAEMTFNHGASLRDIVHQTASDVRDLKDNQQAVSAQIQHLSTEMQRLQASLGRKDSGCSAPR